MFCFAGSHNGRNLRLHPIYPEFDPRRFVDELYFKVTPQLSHSISSIIKTDCMGRSPVSTLTRNDVKLDRNILDNFS